MMTVLCGSRRKLQAPSLRRFYLRSESNSGVIVRSCRFAHFYVAMGATTRDPNIDIPVEAGTSPCQRASGQHRSGMAPGQWERLALAQRAADALHRRRFVTSRHRRGTASRTTARDRTTGPPRSAGMYRSGGMPRLARPRLGARLVCHASDPSTGGTGGTGGPELPAAPWTRRRRDPRPGINLER